MQLMISMLVLMLMRVIMSMMILLFSPMMVHDSQRFKKPLNYEKEQHCQYEYQWDQFAVSVLLLVCIGQNVNHCIADYGPTAQWIQQIDEVKKGLWTN